jgi:acyl phosphate:glycerol-3-phosphate acyltransferase
MLTTLIWAIIGYLCGSLPTAYLAGKWLRGIDLRRYGSGNLGGSNVDQHISRPAGLAVATIDALKALLPAYLGLRLGGYPGGVGGAIGATLGHCWSLYLGFRGGRGMSTTAGGLMPIFPQGSLALIVVHFGASLLHWAPLGDLAAVLAMPLAAWLVTRQPAVALGCVGILLIVLAKRLEANRLPLPSDPAARRLVFARRLLLDRDIATRAVWTERRPAGENRDPKGRANP